MSLASSSNQNGNAAESMEAKLKALQAKIAASLAANNLPNLTAVKYVLFWFH